MCIDMPLISLPNLTLILSPIGGGKTSLIKFLILEHIDKIACCLLFSTTGVYGYEKNYKFLNQKFIYDTWDQNIVEKLMKLGAKVTIKHCCDKARSRSTIQTNMALCHL